MVRPVARWLGRRKRLPTSVGAVFGYYAESGVFDLGSLALKRQVDATIDGMIEDSFAAVEEAIADEFDLEFVAFDYDTKLVLPAKLTLGYCYRRFDTERHPDAERMTALAVDALLDGDMRDAINDDEFGDFEVDFDVSDGERRRVADIAQSVLRDRVAEQFSAYPGSVEDAYERAVDRSERHQEQDETFREYLSAARTGDESALTDIRREYRNATFADPPAIFTDEQLSLPYLKTQYDRVGVIYDAMIEMYRNADLPVEEPFKRSIVLAIIGAQVLLDDVDDYHADMDADQLTPVTAEYLLAESDRAAYESVVDICDRYLEEARREATAADSALTGIATEYIARDGDLDVLPGT